MTVVPPPDRSTVRVRLEYNSSGGALAGNRFYLAYAGGAPTAANCATLATDIAGIWNTNIAPLVHEDYSLIEVDVLDITTETGASGVWNGTDPGQDTSQYMPANAAINVEFNIGRRYRGGKPRIYWPPPGSGAMTSQDKWSNSFITDVNSGTAAFFSAIAALSVGAVGTLTHTNLSYYQGFRNITNSSGRERAVPTYRDTALSDVITGYSTKAVIGSQRRRRTATSP